jgi:glycosyltransferase 2 family protein
LKFKGLFAGLPEAQQASPPARSRRLIYLLSIMLAALLLYLTLRNLDWRIFFRTLQKARYGFLPLIFFLSSISLFVRAVRLRLLLKKEKALPVSNVFWANMAGYLGNNILPMRGGELVRAAYLGQKNETSTTFALAVGLVERLMDLVALVLLGSLALPATGVISPALQNALKLVSLLGLIGLIAVFGLPRFGVAFRRLIMTLPALKEQHKDRLDHVLQQFLSGLTSLHSGKHIVQFISLTGLIWLLDAVNTVALGFILRIPILLQQAFVLLATLGLSSAIPSTPGYVGIYQFVAVTTLAPFGISNVHALAFILISQILGYLIIGFWGLLGVWQFNKQTP